jgi:hypothetical protein
MGHGGGGRAQAALPALPENDKCVASTRLVGTLVESVDAV